MCTRFSHSSHALLGASLATVFDAVTSNTAIALPIKQLVQLCKERGVPVLIDAAHALGQQDCDLQGLGADYWVCVQVQAKLCIFCA